MACSRGRRKRVSAVAVLSLDGTDGMHARMLALQVQGCAAWRAAHAHAEGVGGARSPDLS